MEDIKQVGFTVDAGLINRLGIELVGKAETAVSELIKNAYDADATEVKVKFIDSDEVGGTLIISDNGLGMTEEQLINGFMRLNEQEQEEKELVVSQHKVWAKNLPLLHKPKKVKTQFKLP